MEIYPPAALVDESDASGYEVFLKRSHTRNLVMKHPLEQSRVWRAN